MHWFHNITMNTPIRDIGWTYIVIAILTTILIYCVVKLFKEW